MGNIIGYICLVALFIWFISDMEKIKNVLSDIEDKVSSLDSKSDHMDYFKIDSIDTTAERISTQLESIERKLEDIEEAIKEN